jgi:hypothetical protein
VTVCGTGSVCKGTSGAITKLEYRNKRPIPMAARSKAWVCDRLLAGIADSNPAWGHGCPSLVGVACCQVEVTATGRSLVQRIPIAYRVCGTECDLETSTRKRPRPTRAVELWGGDINDVFERRGLREEGGQKNQMCELKYVVETNGCCIENK